MQTKWSSENSVEKLTLNRGQKCEYFYDLLFSLNDNSSYTVDITHNFVNFVCIVTVSTKLNELIFWAPSSLGVLIFPNLCQS